MTHNMLLNPVSSLMPLNTPPSLMLLNHVPHTMSRYPVQHGCRPCTHPGQPRTNTDTHGHARSHGIAHSCLHTQRELMPHERRLHVHRIAAMMAVLIALGAAAPCAHAQILPKYVSVQIPMRDGHWLAADIFRNDSTTAKPVILVQTPYNKDAYRVRIAQASYSTGSLPYDSAAYNYVVVDWRGFYGSTAAAVQGYDRGLDGYDCVEWAAAQRWCNGKVGTHGGSALGDIQFRTARQHPPHLVCCVPMVKDFKSKYTDDYYGGCLRLEQVQSLERLGFITMALVTSRPEYGTAWKVVERSSDYADELAVPMLIIGGWFDHYPDDVLRAFDDLRTKSAQAVRSQHKIIFGPWGHGGLGTLKQGELQFPDAVGVPVDAARRFFEYWLRGAKNGWPLEPPVRWFQMGRDEWRSTNDWSKVPLDSTTLFLQPGGGLAPAPPVAPADASVIPADPHDPSPSYGGARFNPFDPALKDGPLDIRTVVESRPDVAIFTSDAFTKDLDLIGSITAHLYVSTDRTDGDVAVRLCDVYPDGRSMIMTDGIRRLRFREGEETQKLMSPGVIVSATILLQKLGLTLRAGHRLRIVISGSDYPRFDNNLQNGGAMYAAGDTLPAVLRIHHDASHPSHVGMIVTSLATGVEEFDDRTDQSARTNRTDHTGQTRPAEIILGEAYPSPATDRAMLPVTLQRSGMVHVTVCDILGRTVYSATFGQSNAGEAGMSERGEIAPGVHQLPVDFSKLSPGVYIVHAIAGEASAARVVRVVR